MGEILEVKTLGLSRQDTVKVERGQGQGNGGLAPGKREAQVEGIHGYTEKVGT